jgi:hypothetical protein
MDLSMFSLFLVAEWELLIGVIWSSIKLLSLKLSSSDSKWEDIVPSDRKLKVWILSNEFSFSFPLTWSLKF